MGKRPKSHGMTISSPDGFHFHPPRRPVLQAMGLVIALAPLALVASYHLAGAAGALNPHHAVWITAAITLVGGGLIIAGLIRGNAYPHARLGLCNVITIMRGAGIAVMAGLITTPVGQLGWWLVAMAGAVLALDAADGWAARRAALQSRFGARLDMETDVAFALVLAGLAVALGQVGAWFLLLGLLRPAFIAAGWLLPALRAPLPASPWRRRLAALQMAAQVVLVTPVLSATQGHVLGAVILGTVLASFGTDIFRLLRRSV
jgi:phosphatidylglycerophosphate synthase